MGQQQIMEGWTMGASLAAFLTFMLLWNTVQYWLFGVPARIWQRTQP
jgi:hypothetical protein